MKKSRRDSPGPGTVIRGVDGEIYWIPDNKLSTFKLPQEKADKIKSLIAKCEIDPVVANLDSKFSESIGIAHADEMETFLNLGAIRQKKR